MKSQFDARAEEIIRQTYPKFGGIQTVRELENNGYRVYTLKQIQDKANLLKIKSPINRDDKREPLYQVGQKIGIYRIVKHLGMKRADDLYLGTHVYRIECTNEGCGYQEKKTENGIYQSEQRGTVKCRACGQRERNEQDRRHREEEKQRELELAKMFMWLMFQMKPLPLRYVACARRFDTQRLA